MTKINQCGTITSWDLPMEELPVSEKICQCKGCELPVLALGMCNKHWRRCRKYGSPFATAMHALHGMSADRRFERKHKKMENGCWEWLGSTDQDGYGLFWAKLNGVNYRRAHRFSWAFHTMSPIPADMV